MNNKFLDKVYDQILSETRIIDDKVYTLFSPFPFSLSFLLSFISSTSFPSHCKEVYSLNKEETDYVWDKYKEGVSALIGKKEPAHQEKG